MTRQERIQNMEDDLCRACKDNKRCKSSVPCVMAHRVSTDLVDIGYRKDDEVFYEIYRQLFMKLFNLWEDVDEEVYQSLMDAAKELNICVNLESR